MRVRKLYGLLVQLNFSQLHVYIHAVCFKLFYHCTPVMRVDYELKMHLDLLYTRVLFMSDTNALFIPSHDCFNFAQEIHTLSIFPAHKSM